MKKTKEFTLAETFVGAGGSHLGFKLAGFKTVYANDNDPDMIESFKINNLELSKEIIDGRPIQEVKPEEILKIAKLKKGELDVLFGGIVCTGFSLAGVRDPSDQRNTLYREQLRLVKGLRPKISIIENVPGMKNFLILKEGAPRDLIKRVKHIHQRLEDFKGIKAERRKRNKGLTAIEKKEYEEIKRKKKNLSVLIKNNSVNVVEEIEKKYDELGYKTFARTLNAAWYGTATTRARLIIVAVRKDLKTNFSYPKIEYLNSGGTREDFMKKIKNGLPKEMLSRKLKRFSKAEDTLKKIDYKNKNNPKKDKDNTPMKHGSKTIERFKLIPRGKNIVDVMHKVPRGLKISKYYSRGCTMRLDPGKPAPTLVPGHSNFPVHPYKHRSITVREAAIISGFPTNYIFYGNHTKRCLQVGNAVPPPLAKAIALQAKETLKNYYKNRRY